MMRKVFALILALLVLAVSASAESPLVCDGEGLLTAGEVQQLETLYAEYSQHHGFTPILVTTDSFEGSYAQDYAGDYYDSYGYPNDGILLLVSLTEGQWYILTNGECYDRISDWDAETIGEELVPMLRDGNFYEAFALFPELADQYFSGSSVTTYGGADMPSTVRMNYGKSIAICMGIGMLIGLIAVGVMASQMKSVRMQNSAADYIRPGSMHLTHSRDIFLYSRVHRTPRPKSNSSGGGSRGGGSRGGAGGRI